MSSRDVKTRPEQQSSTISKELLLPVTRTETVVTPMELTAEDAIFWFSVFECLVRAPKIDYTRLAAFCGYSGSEYAATIVGVKRRQMWQHIGKLLQRCDVDRLGGRLASSPEPKSRENTGVNTGEEMLKRGIRDTTEGKVTEKKNHKDRTGVGKLQRKRPQKNLSTPRNFSESGRYRR